MPFTPGRPQTKADRVRALLAKSELEEMAAEDDPESEVTGLHTVEALHRGTLPSSPEIHVHLAPIPDAMRKSDPKSLRESVKSAPWQGIAAAIVAAAGLVTAIVKGLIDLVQVMH